MYQQSLRVEDFPNICRFCLAERSVETVLNPLFDAKNVSLTKTLTKMVDTCLGLKVNICSSLFNSKLILILFQR